MHINWKRYVLHINRCHWKRNVHRCNGTVLDSVVFLSLFFCLCFLGLLSPCHIYWHFLFFRTWPSLLSQCSYLLHTPTQSNAQKHECIHLFSRSLMGDPESSFYLLYLFDKSANCFAYFLAFCTCQLGKHFLWAIFRRKIRRKIERKRRGGMYFGFEVKM